MVNIDSLWGDDFSIKNTKEADLELLEKTMIELSRPRADSMNAKSQFYNNINLIK